MPKTFSCPHCGAPLDYDGSGSATLQCPFCNNTVSVPEELRSAAAGQPASFNWRSLSPAARFWLILLIALFVVPTCLGIAGAFVGIAAGIGAPLLVFLLTFIRH